MAMTTKQLERVRRDLGDVSAAFTDPELNDNWERMSGAENELTRMNAVKGLCFEQLLNSASKMHDYTAGAVDEKLSQVVKHLENRLKHYLPAMEAAQGESKQIVIGKVGKRAHPDRYTPSENQLTGRSRRGLD